MDAVRNKDYVIDKIDKAISELVYNKFKLLKAYNYYNGKRDPELFRYLEENFGIGNPTSVEFTPLTKKHVDALVGEYLDIPTLPKISCKDSETISFINRDKLLEITKTVFDYFKSKLNNDLLSFLQSGQTTLRIQDNSIKKELDKLIEDIDNSFISKYEVAAQDVLEYVIQSRVTNLADKKRLLILDLLIGAEAFYKVKPSAQGTNIAIEVLNPLNTFIEKNPESQYAKDGYRAVVRKWMSKELILATYGNKLNKDSIKELEEMYEHYSDNNYLYVRSTPETLLPGLIMGGDMAGVDAGHGVIPGYPADTYASFNYKFLPVYEVEWIETDKVGKEFVLNRYEGVRIGESIYIPTGLSEHIIRTQDAPNYCGLSIGGMWLVNRDNIPTSLILQCANLQDKYDVVMYLRDNVLANSGASGDWLDVSMLPSFLGADMTERILKWMAYKKGGVALVDSSQDGRGFNNNTFMSGFDDAAKVQTMLAFDLVLARIEELVSSITGVFRERLNGITLKDAVSNIEAGARNSFTITKPFYQQMDILINDILGDCLDMAKIVWKDGITGTIILGHKLLKIFTALPEYYTHTDYDIHIVPSTQILKDLQLMQGVVIELIKSGMMEPDMASEAMTSRSLTELKDYIKKSWAKKKEENNQILQLSQKLEESQQQIQLLTQLNQLLSAKLQQFDQARLLIEKQRLENDTEIRWYQAMTERDYKTKLAETDEKKVLIELSQLYDGNPYNDKIRFR